MATKIVTKNSSTASAVPTASDLVQGELAVNVADKKLFTEDNSGAIIELADGVKLAGIEASADVTDTANVTAAGALMDSELTSEASVKALNQGVATTDSPAFAGLTVDTTTLTVDSTNNRVGIGTSSPSNTLDVAGTMRYDGRILTNSTTSDGTAASPSIVVGYDYDNGFFRPAADTIGFTTGGSERMRIDSSGKVGIGTSSPANTLDVLGDVYSGAFYRDVDVTSVGPAGSFIQVGARSGSTRTPAAAFGSVLGNPATTGSAVIQTLSGGSLTERMRIDSSGQVGIGTTSPSAPLHVKSSGELARLETTSSGGNNYLTFYKPSDARKGFIGYGGGSTDNQLYINNDENADIVFRPNNSEAMRIDSSGNVSIGTTTAATALGTSTSSSDTGVSMAGTGRISIANNNSYPLALNRYTSEGSLIQLNEAGVTRGAIGIKGNEPFIVDTAAGLRMSGQGTANVLPVNSVGNATNQALNLGSSTLSFDTVFADDFTNTSDRNYKQDIEELLEAELRVATACKGLMKKYRMKHAVVKKGDDARIHVGIIAQDLRDAFTAEGLDAGRYGMFVSETVWEESVEVPSVEAADAVYETQTDEEGNESQVLISEAIEAVDGYTDVNHYWTEEEAPDTAVARTKMGVRYSQLLAFIIAAL